MKLPGTTHAHFVFLIATIILFLMKNPWYMKALKCSLAVLIPAIYIKPVGLMKHDAVMGSSSSSTMQTETTTTTGNKVSPKRATSKKET